MQTLDNEGLARARRDAGLSQQTAATAVGISTSTLQAAESARTEPRASVIASLAALYGVTDLWSLFQHTPESATTLDGRGKRNRAHHPDRLETIAGAAGAAHGG